jgi:acetyl-CoA C-acetyltransferase
MVAGSADVFAIGVGQVPVGEHWELSIRDLAVEAGRRALADAGLARVGAVYVGNMLAPTVNGQQHLGALVASWLGQRQAEAVTVEAACGSGGAALRQGYLGIRSGAHEAVLVLGVEKMTDCVNGTTTAALAMAADAEYEAGLGLSFVAINALLMRRYMYEFGVPRQAFARFAVLAHANALGNPMAMFRKEVSVAEYMRAPFVADPIGLLDSSPMADGAAAVVLASGELARSLGRGQVRVAGSAVATDYLALHDRLDPLDLVAVRVSTARALGQAGLSITDVSFFEPHDAFTVMAVLCLEACGFARRGEACALAARGHFDRGGALPICTMGGLKARGHPVGATGVYQAVEAVLQLRQEAGACQVQGAKVGLIQNVGGSGATAITHVLVRE